jgi:hypothetical protein
LIALTVFLSLTYLLLISFSSNYFLSSIYNTIISFENVFNYCFFQGIWSPQKIPNPDYFEDDHPFLLTSFTALGLELWSMTPDIYFDNFIICSEKEVADRWATDGWRFKIMVAKANEVW